MCHSKKDHCGWCLGRWLLWSEPSWAVAAHRDQREKTHSCEEDLGPENRCCDLLVCSFPGGASLFSAVSISLFLMDLLVLPSFKETYSLWKLWEMHQGARWWPPTAGHMFCRWRGWNGNGSLCLGDDPLGRTPGLLLPCLRFVPKSQVLCFPLLVNWKDS